MKGTAVLGIRFDDDHPTDSPIRDNSRDLSIAVPNQVPPPE